MLSHAIRSLIDYLLFTCGFVLAVQLPEFIQQYLQFLAGKLSEANWHLAGYQKIADQQFAGDMQRLINEYMTSSSQAFQQTGDLVRIHLERVAQLNQDVQGLQTSEYLEKVIYFFSHIQLEDAQNVAEHYQLAVPLTLEALTTGFVLAVVFVAIRVLITKLLTQLFSGLNRIRA